MKSLCFLIVVAMLFACSNEPAKEGAKSSGKGPSAKGKKNREVAVEVYIATPSEQARQYQTMATLTPINSVSLSAAASGRLVLLNARDGMNVKKGALLAKIDDAELQAQLKQAEASMSLAQQKYERTKNLYEKDGITKENLESVEASLKSAEASVELIKAQIEKTEVRAAFPGKLGLVKVSLGAWLTAGSPIADLSEVRKLKVVFALPQRFAAAVKVGDEITVIDQERGLNKVGKVKALDATISESSRTRQILVEIDNVKGELIAGGYAKVVVPLSEHAAPVMSIPAEALTLDKDGGYVYVVKNGKAVIKHVVTALRTPISVDVTSGLDEGDSVVVSGLMSMREGVGIKVKDVRRTMNYEVRE
ncbi:MAG: efflux RND transporter periplasmic adaptor subunit [Fibrobacter sp.]|nr:efflux RND transporter periplasmic adaptor subunit [Fibrobacter sp.]